MILCTYCMQYLVFYELYFVFCEKVFCMLFLWALDGKIFFCRWWGKPFSKKICFYFYLDIVRMALTPIRTFCITWVCISLLQDLGKVNWTKISPKLSGLNESILFKFFHTISCKHETLLSLHNLGEHQSKRIISENTRKHSGGYCQNGKEK